MIYPEGGETGFVERMVIESVERGLRGRCRFVFFFPPRILVLSSGASLSL